LNELYRAIPEKRELCLSRTSEGIFFRIVDFSAGSRTAQVQEMIPGEKLLRAGADIEKVFFDRLRTMNAKLDRKLADG
jgi:hypothetical protein